MEWVYVVLIIGIMLYIGGIVLDYSNYDTRLRPQIVDLKRQALELASLAENEIRDRDRAQDRVDLHKPAIEELQNNLETMRQKVKTEGVRKNRLEMVLLKTSLRHTPRLSLAMG